MNGASMIGGGGFAVGAGFAVTQLGDFDGDGKTDLLIENGASRWFYYMNGASVASSVAAPGAASGWVVVGTADYNGDGRSDLLWRNGAAPSQHWIYLLNGTAIVGSGGFAVSPGYVANVPN
jgi:hypothetical protein